jgi:hypothetical protein
VVVEETLQPGDGRRTRRHDTAGALMPEQTFVIPVSVADARLWVTGAVQDIHLIMRASLVPEVIFAGALPPGRAALRQILGEIAYWKRRGAFAMIARAEGRIIQHYFKVGARSMLQEVYPNQVKHRFLLTPEVFNRWTSKFCRDLQAADPPPQAALALARAEPGFPPITTSPG